MIFLHISHRGLPPHFQIITSTFITSLVYFGPIPFFKDEIPNFPAQKHRNTSPSSFFTQCSASAEDTNGGFSLCRATLCQVIVPCRQAEPDSGRWRSLNPRNYGEQYAGKYGQHGEDMEKIYGENMGNIWGKYGENMGKSWKPSWFHTSGTFLGAAILNTLQCHH